MSIVSSDDGIQYRYVGGTIRNNGSGWSIIHDQGHYADDISVGEVTSKYIEIIYPPAVRVVNFITAPDETFAQPPLSAVFGASVGLERAYIYGTVEGRQFNPSTWENNSANIWISGRFVTSGSPFEI